MGMQTLDLRTLRFYFRPGKTPLTADGAVRIEYGLRAALSPEEWGRASGWVRQWQAKGRVDQGQLSRLCAALVRAEAKLAATATGAAQERARFEEMLALRQQLADLRTRRRWSGLSGEEQAEVLAAYRLWPRLAAAALGETKKLAGGIGPDEPRTRRALAALLRQYVSAAIWASGQSMLRRAKELMPKKRLLLPDEGSEGERKAADAAVARVQAIAARARQEFGEAARVQGGSHAALSDRRVMGAERAILETRIGMEAPQ